LPLYKQVTLESTASVEHGQPFGYTIETHTPRLSGSDDPRVVTFNDEMVGIVSGAATEFKQNLAAVPPTPVSAASSFTVHYTVLSPPGDVLSIKFDMEGYVTGAAHPFHQSSTVNYDLEEGRDLALADLFRPGADFLEAIARYCIGELQKRDIAFDPSDPGAAPTAENYRNWNITGDGLMITFDEYQVAPYAAGPQLVVVPYADLGTLTKVPGPLSPYFPH
jgi:hypothetical protein